MNRSPLLDFRERNYSVTAYLFGVLAGTNGAYVVGYMFSGSQWFIWIGILNLILAKYTHSKLPVKRKRKEKALEPDHEGNL